MIDEARVPDSGGNNRTQTLDYRCIEVILTMMMIDEGRSKIKMQMSFYIELHRKKSEILRGHCKFFRDRCFRADIPAPCSVVLLLA